MCVAFILKKIKLYFLDPKRRYFFKFVFLEEFLHAVSTYCKLYPTFDKISVHPNVHIYFVFVIYLYAVNAKPAGKP